MPRCLSLVLASVSAVAVLATTAPVQAAIAPAVHVAVGGKIKDGGHWCC